MSEGCPPAALRVIWMNNTPLWTNLGREVDGPSLELGICRPQFICHTKEGKLRTAVCEPQE